MTDSGREPIEVVQTMHDWFTSVPFEDWRKMLLENEDWESFLRACTERGFGYPDLIDPEVEIPAAGIGGLRDQAGFKGQAGWLRFWRAWFEPWADYKWTVSNPEQIGGSVVLDVSNVAHGRESGAPVEWTNTQIWTIRDGRVVHLVGYETRAEAMAALDAE